MENKNLLNLQSKLCSRFFKKLFKSEFFRTTFSLNSSVVNFIIFVSSESNFTEKDEEFSVRQRAISKCSSLSVCLFGIMQSLAIVRSSLKKKRTQMVKTSKVYQLNWLLFSSTNYNLKLKLRILIKFSSLRNRLFGSK